MMERRNFLKILPIAAISPKVVRDGVVSLELPNAGHYVIVADVQRVNIDDLCHTPGILPEGSTGGYIVCVHGNPDEAIKFYRMEQDGTDVKT